MKKRKKLKIESNERIREQSRWFFEKGREGGVNTNIRTIPLWQIEEEGHTSPFRCAAHCVCAEKMLRKRCRGEHGTVNFWRIKFHGGAESTYLPGKQFIRIQRGEVE
ncbi:hypothetical protein CEXT_444701 [Caerostris extrusa]|uniref:Uncharacterized protein n=1 Tax=Caerostris extrusa TaxID=172846 RepID=A0AAV4ULN3_CAEEX|nr:hypothetical protein CEXT_444701 [Caerostris extrusa]